MSDDHYLFGPPIEVSQTATRLEWRRGGPGFDYACKKPETIECALYDCQRINRCSAIAKSAAR